MEKNKGVIRELLKFEFELGHNAKEALNNINRVVNAVEAHPSMTTRMLAENFECAQNRIVEILHSAARIVILFRMKNGEIITCNNISAPPQVSPKQLMGVCIESIGRTSGVLKMTPSKIRIQRATMHEIMMGALLPHTYDSADEPIEQLYTAGGERYLLSLEEEGLSVV